MRRDGSWGTSLCVAVVGVFVACGTHEDVPTGWAAVQNPVLAFEDVAVKDAFAIHEGDTWHFGYSAISDAPPRIRLGFSTTANLRDYVEGPVLDDAALGGLASPDVVRGPDGRWIVTYNSHTHDLGSAQPKLYYRTSSDLSTWS